MQGGAQTISIVRRMKRLGETAVTADAMVVIQKHRDADGKLALGDAKLSASLADMVSDLFSIIARGETVTLVPLSRQLAT